MNFSEQALKEHIATVPDFPKPGILFRDVTSLLTNVRLMKMVIAELEARTRSWKPDVILGLEARGFLFGPPLAMALDVSFVPARKPGKLPRKTIKYSYELEYGSDALEVHADSLVGKRVAIVDDLLATGGTAAAAEALIKQAGGECVGSAFVIELAALGGRKQLKAEATSLAVYE